MKFLFSIFLLILVCTSLNISLMAQSAQGNVLVNTNFKRTFPENGSSLELDFPTAFYMDKTQMVKATQEELGLTSKDIIGKEMIYDFGIYTVDLIISTDSTLLWKDIKTMQWVDEKSKTIHIDEYTTLVSWLEADKTFVTMLSDFGKSKAYAFLYRSDGRIAPIPELVKLKE